MYDFDGLLGDVLKGRPELDKDSLLRLIEEKKKAVGGGYLTDQGALFLIAGEFGIQLRNSASSDLTLKDLYLGANDITIVARVLAVYPISQYTKKDGSSGKYLRMNLFDDTNVTRLTAWDDNAEVAGKLGVKVDTPIRVGNGYVRQGLDGRPNLNVGRRGKIEIIEDEDLSSRLISISKLEKDVGEVGSNQSVPVVRGKLSSEVRKSNFTRNDGSAGAMTQFRISSEEGKRELRIVIWNDLLLPEMKIKQSIRVTNLRLKPQSSGEAELHGDNASTVGVITLTNETNPMLVAPTSGSKAPTIGTPSTKVRDVKALQTDIAIDVIALSKGLLQDVHLRDGTTVPKGEVTVGDETGEIKLVAWREFAAKLLKIEPGERLRISGLKRQVTRMGVELLELTNSSTIEKVS